MSRTPLAAAAALLVVTVVGCHDAAKADPVGTPAPAPAPKPVETTAPAPAPAVPAVPDKAEEAKTAKAFGDIYSNATWGTNTTGIGNSGTGSTEQSTAVYRAVLQQFLADNHITSVVDAGGGDWEFSHLIDWKGISYKGFDIVASVVAQDKQRYAAPNIEFAVGNIVEDDLPPADLLVSKHVLQHLPTADVQKFFAKQLKKYKYVLLTDGVDPTTMSATNSDIEPGEYRQLDPTKPPFNLAGTKLVTYWDGHHMSQIVLVERP